MKKWIWTVIILLVIGFVGFQYFNSKSNAQEATAQVRTATVQKGKLEVKISGSGSVASVTSADITAAADNQEIDEVLVAAGEEVNAGDELITFTDGSDPITAPAAGTITSVSVAAGQRVTSGQAVAHLTNYQDFQTVIQVDELDISKIKVDQTADITVSAYPDKTFTGKVTAVAAEGTSSNGVATFDVTIHIENPENLKVGMSTEASILTESKEDALYVPVDAVHTNGDQKYVIVTSASNGSGSSEAATEQKTVKTGIANEDYVEITEGLSEGETIQLPALAASSSSTSEQGRSMQGFGGMGGFSGGVPQGRMGGTSGGSMSGRGGQ
ncbi:efflux RND transporter periplasmic adaptor subunit [Neobacillus muris]|uniref:efflux RND transporter periplasmic adaptor subunit n=1 Tax=Neobacillus muris TaxID=2941334 RepID=UPI00203EA797|nr:efflux RND transporter periplasmic adaptor subunit [Neobacillus muris]